MAVWAEMNMRLTISALTAAILIAVSGCNLDKPTDAKSPPSTPGQSDVEDPEPTRPILSGYRTLTFGPPYKTTLSLSTSWADGELSYILRMNPRPASAFKVEIELTDEHGFMVYKFPVFSTEVAEIEGLNEGKATGMVKMPWKQFRRVIQVEGWNATIGPAIPVIQ